MATATWGNMVQAKQVTPSNRRGKGQGYFRYYRSDGTFESIVAVNGKLLRNGGDLAITGLPSGFQTDRMIEAVQYKDKLYIATGSGLVQYDGTTAALVTPYTPDPLEALYIGTNALAANPDQYLADGTGTPAVINGVTVDKRKGIVNQTTTFTAYVTKPAGMNLKYMFLYKKKAAQTYLAMSDGAAVSDPKTDTTHWQDAKTATLKFDSAEDYDIKVLIRDATASSPYPILSEYYIPLYTVTRYNENQVEPTNGINTCNRILLHWDRLILYGDTINKNLIHISHLKNPAYFPTNNTLAFETDKQEPLTKIVQYRDFLVAFLPGSIQALYGKSPLDYTRVRLHTGVGCIAPETAQVLGNVIAFLSKEGIYVLKSFGLSESKMNVERIDTKIANLIPPYPESGDACAIVHNDQYHICFPSRKIRLRFYQNSKYWTKDESPYFDFCRFYEWKGDLVVQSQSTGEVYQFDEDTFDDLGYVYEDRIETKSYDFGIPYNPKKLKEVHVIVGLEGQDTAISVEAYGDSGKILDTDTSYASVKDGKVQWNEQFTPNAVSESGTVFDDWELGVDTFGETKTAVHKLRLKGGRKYRTCKVLIKHKEAKPYKLLGLGFVFKVRKP